MLHRDDFLAGILGRPCWRVEVPKEGLDAAALDRLAAEPPAPAMLHARVDTADMTRVRQLESVGFRIVEALVTLDRPGQPVGNPASAFAIRHAQRQSGSERKGVMELAGACFSTSRLHLDPEVTREQADRSRAEWAGNFFGGGRGDHMLIAVDGDRIVGFLQILGPKDGTLTIDLIGVAGDVRRRGVARELIAFAVRELPCRQLRVGTQICNVPALRLYEKLGFRIASSSYALHCHRLERSAA